MAYAAATNPRRRISTGLAVVSLQALAAYGVVTALTVTGVITPPPPRDPTATNMPLPPPPDDPFKHHKKQTEPDTARSTITTTETIITLPTPTPSVLPSDSFSPGPTIGTGPTGSASALPSETPSPPIAPKAPRARGNSGDWVTPNDYPSQDLREGNQGVTRVLLGVGADGRVAGCSVTGSSGFATLDVRACERLRARGRFDPATDASAAKIAGSFRTSVRWTIPK